MSKIQIPVYVELANMPPGSYKLKSELPWYKRFLSNEKLGWLHVSVDNKDGDIGVLWLTNRNSHLSLTNDPALAITLRADGYQYYNKQYGFYSVDNILLTVGQL